MCIECALVKTRSKKGCGLETGERGFARETEDKTSSKYGFRETSRGITRHGLLAVSYSCIALAQSNMNACSELSVFLMTGESRTAAKKLQELLHPTSFFPQG